MLRRSQPGVEVAYGDIEAAPLLEAKVRTDTSEFFGFSAAIRDLVRPVSTRYPWIRYPLAFVAFGLFAVAWLTADGLWQLAVLAVWMLIGAIWFFAFSRWRDSWWTRKRGYTRTSYVLWSSFTVLLIAFGCATWCLWMAFGEDQFD